MAVYTYADFELNDDSRSLSLDGKDISVQPLVFDFLNYLLKHQERAVSKDELMAALWPQVTVTEASLQRVASLARQALRRGRAEEALRSISRFGYRLCFDSSRLSDEAASTQLGSETQLPEVLIAARRMVAARQWRDAAASFQEADAAERLSPADLEQYAMALECSGRLADAVDPLMRATAAYCDDDKPTCATRSAISLTRVHLEKGEFAVASGWHRRAASLLGANRSCPEYGLWCWMGSRMAAAQDKAEEALALANEAYGLGQTLKNPVVESLGLIYRGFFRLCLGETEAGLDDQHLAAAQGLSSNPDPIVGGILYCNILWACRNFADWARANEWTASYVSWCGDSGLPNLTGSCRLHRAEVLGLRGTLNDARQLILEAIDQLAHDAPWATGDAFRVLGDIHLAIGDFEEAAAAYQKAHAVGWDPQPGLARLHVELGDLEAAYAGLERSLHGTGWFLRQRRGLILASLASVAAQTGRDDRARELLAELESQPGRWPMPSIRALIAEAKAEVFRRGDRLDEAVTELQSACGLWIAAQSPINAAEARLRLARLLLSRGDISGVRLEVEAVKAIADSLDSPRLKSKLAAIGSDQALSISGA